MPISKVAGGNWAHNMSLNTDAPKAARRLALRSAEECEEDWID